jgi:hypothetical protein
LALVFQWGSVMDADKTKTHDLAVFEQELCCCYAVRQVLLTVLLMLFCFFVESCFCSLSDCRRSFGEQQRQELSKGWY